MTKKSEGSSSRSIMELLPEEERAAHAVRAAQTELHRIAASSKTVGDLVAAIEANEFVDDLRAVAVPASWGVLQAESKRARAPRTPIEKVDVEKVLAFVVKNPNKKTGEIVTGTGLDKKIVGRALAKLRKDKNVKTVGEKRSMTYAAA